VRVSRDRDRGDPDPQKDPLRNRVSGAALAIIHSFGWMEQSAMGLFSHDVKTMDDLFLHGMQDIYYTEKQILKALPDMIENATNRELSAALRKHLGETEKQVQRRTKRPSDISTGKN
jgi:hypothetical protein